MLPVAVGAADTGTPVVTTTLVAAMNAVAIDTPTSRRGWRDVMCSAPGR
jgi:hypothetical protein